MTLRRWSALGECDPRTQGGRTAALFGRPRTNERAAPRAPTTQGFVLIRVSRLAAGLLAALALGLALVGAAAAAPNPADLEAELVCPTCHTTLDQSDAPVARRMKQIIRQRIREGASERQIKSEFVAQFGQGVLATPPKSGFDLLAWLLPLAGLVVGAAAVGALAWTWSRRRRDEAPEPEEPLDPALERRLDDELARFEG